MDMRFDGRRESDNVESQAGGFGLGGGGGGGGLGLLLWFVFSRFGIVGVLILGGLMFFLGGNPLGLSSGGGDQAGAPSRGVEGRGSSVCSADPKRHFACQVLASTEDRWTELLRAEGETYTPPTLVFYPGSGRSGCGAAQSAMGPFYCPTDRRIYLDTSFFDELANRFGAKGDFAQDYVIAHEFGHHIQNLLGTSDQVEQQMARAGRTEGNRLSVKLELQADCYAGVWAAANRDRLDPGDLTEGMTAAHAIGDDTLQQESQGRVMPDSFTHGTAAQRAAWLKRGIDTGDPAQCDTFNEAI
jgi:hypothetical protein